MSIIALVVYICLLGALGYVVSILPWILPPFKQIVYILLVIIAILIVLDAFGLLGNLNQSVPRIR